MGSAYGPGAERGIFLSNDGGATWQKTLFKDENTGAIDVQIDPDNPQTVCAAMTRIVARPGAPILRRPAAELFISRRMAAQRGIKSQVADFPPAMWAALGWLFLAAASEFTH